ncbi:MAG TPA: branched-chain amino acid ABC transporter permease [Ruminococcus flavefaciens]|jgi:undecaprenyl pyrophosphate phosphatase UppP|nr:branched-chain amino acid ABC transporter permease [Ruminococcus flavefaciens]
MTVTTETIITAAAIITSLVVIFGAIFTIFRWYLKQEKQDRDIKDIKEEQLILTIGVLACLKGLAEQGCDGPVTDAIASIEAHINKQAHK